MSANQLFMNKARQIVLDHLLKRLDDGSDIHICFEDVYIVWFSKTLQNWKALVSTTLEDGMYYEVTYDGDKHQAYLDVYNKIENRVIKD